MTGRNRAYPKVRFANHRAGDRGQPGWGSFPLWRPTGLRPRRRIPFFAAVADAGPEPVRPSSPQLPDFKGMKDKPSRKEQGEDLLRGYHDYVSSSTPGARASMKIQVPETYMGT